MHSFRSSFLFSGLLAVGISTNAHAVNLVTNGGFETGDFTGWTTTAAVPAAASNFGVGSDSHSGNFGAYFSGLGPSYDEITQVLATNSGTQYDVEFWIKNFGAGGDSLVITWEGVAALDLTIVGTELEQWVQVTFQVTANANGSTFKISGYDPNTFVIDDVSVTAVPEVGTLALAGLSAVGVVVAAIKRRKT